MSKPFYTIEFMKRTPQLEVYLDDYQDTYSWSAEQPSSKRVAINRAKYINDTFPGVGAFVIESRIVDKQEGE